MNYAFAIFILLCLIVLAFQTYLFIRFLGALDDLRFLADCARKKNPGTAYRSSAIIIACFVGAAAFLVGMLFLMEHYEAAIPSATYFVPGLV